MDPIRDLLEIAQRKNIQNRPFVSLSYAQSLDGSLTIQQGRHTALSSNKSWAMTHELRAAHDGLLVGIGSVLSDDPRLTVRLANGENPRPVILDSRLRMPIDAQMLSNEKKPWIFTSESASKKKQAALEEKGAQIFVVQHSQTAQLDLCDTLKTLHKQGIQRLMVEGGAKIISSFLNNQLADYLVLTVSMKILGGYPAVQEKLGSYKNDTGFPLSPTINEAKTSRYEDDIVIWGEFDYLGKAPC